MVENNKNIILKLINSIKSRNADFLPFVKDFETLVKEEDSNINNKKFDDVKSALQECFNSICEASEYLNEAEFSFKFEADDKQEDD